MPRVVLFSLFTSHFSLFMLVYYNQRGFEKSKFVQFVKILIFLEPSRIINFGENNIE